MSAAEKFLEDFESRPITEPSQTGLEAEKYILGQGKPALEVVVCTSTNQPKKSHIEKAQKERKNGRASPVLLTVIHGDKADLCGPSGDKPPVHQNIQLEVIEKFCRTALKQSNRNKALKFCSHFLPSLENGLFGINNKGLLSSHHLVHGVTKRSDWEEAKNRSKKISSYEKKELLKGLGFHIEKLDNFSYVLKSRDKKRALAVLLDPSEDHESKEQRFNQLSPVSYAMDKADQEAMPWVLMVQDNHIRIYSTKKEAGVSHSSRTETFIECQPSLLEEKNLGYLWLIFSAEALSKTGSLNEILKDSRRFSEDVAKNLKTRIYEKIVPQIAKGIFHSRVLKNPSLEEELNETYQMTLTVLFRLLFIAYGEDSDLLPYNTNSAYRHRSLKQKAQELSELFQNGGNVEEKGDNHWKEVVNLWKAIDKGNSEWGIMAYNGGLFSSEKTISKIGYEISKLSVPNSFFVPALKDLLLIESSENPLAPVDFRFLGPREFGTIYEGLLESNLAIADSDLTLDNKNIYVPLQNLKTSKKKKSKEPVVHKGEIYLHNQSGARKATGSYYTKPFIVEHILDKSLEPALKEHFKRLDQLHDKEATKEFFNFSTADISMGSGHFLVAAVDRIEKAMSDYLDKRPLVGVQKILDKIRSTAEKNLKDISSNDYFSVENKKILARQIARHCIYGVDNNDLAVQLARLSLWTHTFIPGLPLSYFNHNLICGNSLIGIGTIEEFQSEFKFKDIRKLINTEKLIGQSKKPLQDMKKLSDLSLEEVQQSRKNQKEIESSLKDTKALFDVVIFNRITNNVSGYKIEDWIQNPKNIHKSKELKSAYSELKGLKTLHFPIAFPEVFLRDRPGFDVIVGNPPWEKIKLEKHAFWARYFPGLRGLSQRDREIKYEKIEKQYPELVQQYESELQKLNKFKNFLKKASYIKSSAGDSDLYKFFCWRFWSLICSENGFMGVVLKGSVCQSKGSENFRKEIFQKSKAHITTLVNNSGWVFEGVDGIRVSLLCLERTRNFDSVSPIKDKHINKNIHNHSPCKKNNVENVKKIHIQGLHGSFKEFNSSKKQSFYFSNEQVLSWTDSASLPSLPKEESLNVFLQLRKSPRLDLDDKENWKVRPDTEMHTTKEKPLMDLQSKECPKGFWPVFTGESFNIWKPDTKKPYAYANPEDVINWLYKKRINGNRSAKSVHSEFSSEYVKNKKTLPCLKARLAFRDVGSADRPRTIHISLIPPKVFLVHKAPYFLFPKGDEKDESFLLGVLSSIPLDWYARLFISTNNVGFFILNTFPILRPPRTNPLWEKIVKLSGRLASPDKRFTKWAEAVGVEYGPLDEDKKNDMIHELDAIVAHLYGLSEKQLTHIFETFHRTWDYTLRLNAVLKHYNSWKKKLNQS